MDPLNLYEFETVPDAPMPAGSDAVEPDSPEPAPAGAEAVEEPVDEQQVEEEPTPEEMQEALREFIRDELMAYQGSQAPEPGYDQQYPQQQGYDQQQQQGYGPPQPFDWSTVDPYDENFGQLMGHGLRQEIHAAMGAYLAPVTGTLQAAQAQAEQEHGEEMVQDMLEAEISSGPDLTETSKAMLRPLAESLIPQIQARYGGQPHPRHAEMAINQAADMLRQSQYEAAQGGVQQHTNQMANLNQAPATTPPAGTLAAVPTASAAPPLDAAALARKWGVKPR